MATITYTQGSRTSLLSLGTLASATYITSNAYDRTASQPWDVCIEVEFDPNGTPSGNEQLVIFAKLSLDNSNYTSGPESGTTATEEQDLHFIGVCPCNDTNTHRRIFSLEGLPKARYFKIVAKNDLGVALTSGTIYTADIAGTIA